MTDVLFRRGDQTFIDENVPLNDGQIIFNETDEAIYVDNTINGTVVRKRYAGGNLSRSDIDMALLTTSENPVANKVVTNAIGNLPSLQTDTKTDLVGAINEVNTHADTAQSTANIAQNAITAEATARQTADNTLQTNISSEASIRATQDGLLQSQINQIIAPSGEAPSAAEVQNARIGADGVTYETLGEAIRTNDKNIKLALDDYNSYDLFVGNITKQDATGGGLTWTWSTYDNSCHVEGTKTGISTRPLCGNNTTIPSFLKKNVRYYVKYSSSQIYLHIRFYEDEIEIPNTAIQAFNDTSFVIPNNATGMFIRLVAYSTNVNDTIKPVLLTEYTNGELHDEINDIALGANGYTYDSAGNAVREQFNDINKYIDKIFTSTRFDFDTVATTLTPLGFRTGYISNAGSFSNSTKNICSNMINHTLLNGYDLALITPPTGYFAWAVAHSDDAWGVSHFYAVYGDYTKREINKPILIPLTEGKSLTVCIGRWPNDDAADYVNNSDFIDSIHLDLLQMRNDNPYKGFKLSLLGDSISAFVDDIPEGNRSYYSGSSYGITSTDFMWYSVLCADLQMEKLIINGWSGSCVTSGVRNDETYVPASDASRCEALHNGAVNPDIILIAMGVNDYTYMSSSNQFGDWDGTTALGTESDLSDYVNTDFRKAYATMIARMQKKYPSAKIVCITPWFCERKTTDTGVTYLNSINKQENDYGKAIKEIANIMNVKVIDGTNIGFNRYNFYPTYAEDSASIPTHPNATGQEYMGHAIARELLNL